MAGSISTAPGKKAQINGGSICIFDNSLSPQNRDDISNSILLAQLASNKKFNCFSEPVDWYSFYFETLGKIGWNEPDYSFITHSDSGSRINWSKLVLDSIGNTTKNNARRLAESGMKAWSNLDPNGKAMLIWSENTIQKKLIHGDNQKFEIISSSKSTDGNVVIVISAIFSQVIGQPNGFLSWKEQTEISTSSCQLVLNEDVYRTVRTAVLEKLGHRPEKFIADLPL